MMKLIFPEPLSESLNTRVSFEFLNGMCVRFLSISAWMHWPRLDKLPLIEVSSWIFRSRSSGGRSLRILNFSEPARSTIRSCGLKKKAYQGLHDDGVGVVPVFQENFLLQHDLEDRVTPRALVVRVGGASDSVLTFSEGNIPSARSSGTPWPAPGFGCRRRRAL